jgi:hypothetical protein
MNIAWWHRFSARTVFPTRTWVCSPSPETLRTWWRVQQSSLFEEGRDATMDKGKPPLPGTGTHNASAGPLRHDTVSHPAPVRNWPEPAKSGSHRPQLPRCYVSFCRVGYMGSSELCERETG